MCGVFGFSKLTPQTRAMGHLLAFAMEARGDDSWGGSDGEEIIKRSCPISENFEIPSDWKRAIFHTRAATVGEVSERNAHPFAVWNPERMVVGIHNGGVSNYTELNNRFKRECQVDSEHIFHHLLEGKPLSDLYGRGTIVWFDSKDTPGQINLARWNFSDLEVARLGDNQGLVFCSTREPISRAARMCRVPIETFYQTLVDGHKHWISVDGQLIKGDSMGFENRTHNSNYHHHSRPANGDTLYGFNSTTYNARCKKCHQIETDEIICSGCMKRLRVEFEKQYHARA